MPETEARAPAIYDRERELTDPELASSGRHRRPAPDWGGDELFARGSRRRRDRSTTNEWSVRTREAARARSEARLDRPPLDPGPAARPRPDRSEPASHRGAADPGEPTSHRGAADPREPASHRGAADPGEPASHRSSEPGPDHGHAVRPHVTADHTEPPVGGRRTVLITGRPGTQRTGTPWARPSAERRRPPRTIDERLGARPDRVAAWAFGLGLLLILIAVTTADAATLP